jgi:hypothetical protein
VKPPKEAQYKGPKTIPSQVQLPGGVVLKSLPFKIVEYHPDGTPKLFELQPASSNFDIKAEDTCVMFAREEVLRTPWQSKDTSSPT